MPLYAEVIVPKPLEGTFTYLVPDEMADAIKCGSRVVVPFGRKRYYTGVVDNLTNIRPETGVELKEIEALLDCGMPVVRHPQLKFWHWIADYYLSPLGDVMKAALPSGLKPESETVIEASGIIDADDAGEISDDELTLLTYVDKKGKSTMADIAKALALPGLERLVARMLDRGLLAVSERVVERYRAVRVDYLHLNVAQCDHEALTAAFEKIKRAPSRQQAFMALVTASGFGRPDTELKPVPRAQLVEQTALPASTFKHLEKLGLCTVERRVVSRFSFVGKASGVLPQLSQVQADALKHIEQSFVDHKVTLLRGVTSSGKTEVYMHMMQQALDAGNQVLMLVPEIALTTQLTSRVQQVFGDKVVVYHSKFTDNERVEIWRRLLSTSEPLIVIGARSAVFLPFAKLGLVIVDEEHESSYKQFDPAPRYNARDSAIVLAQLHGAKTLLGSATPMVETYYKARQGKYGLVELTERYGGASLPQIEIIDMAKERAKHAFRGPLSRPVRLAVDNAVKDGHQAIIFLNRRGFSPLGRCRLCQYVLKCQHCDVSLTYHQHPQSYVCHYCGAVYPVPQVCPACHEPAISVVGYGTERIEEEILEQFADTRVLRMDLDTTRAKDGYARIIEEFSERKADLLVGTQMVTKGLDFSGVTAVVVVSADALVSYPDFRASERAFALLEQVSGRAGRRGQDQGKVMVQTYKPDHPVIRYLESHDYQGFYEYELAERRAFNYPPFARVINIYLKHRDERALEIYVADYVQRLQYLLGNRVSQPVRPTVSRVQSLYIRTVMVKLENEVSVSKVKEILRGVYVDVLSQPGCSGLMVYYDVDPC